MIPHQIQYVCQNENATALTRDLYWWEPSDNGKKT